MFDVGDSYYARPITDRDAKTDFILIPLTVLFCI